MREKSYAPVFVTVYDRPAHFKKCIDSLKNNVGASETTLFVSSDGARDERSKEKVAIVRDYIKTISGFKRVVAFTPEENTRGLIKKEVRNRVQEFSDRYICSEDDNIFSPYFLSYMNKALDLYEDDDRIRSISGYMYPGFPAQELRPILIQAHAGWGVGYWRDKDSISDLDQKDFAQEIFADRGLFTKINNGLPHMAPKLKQMAEGRLIAGDVIRSALLFKHDWYSVFPSISLVRNIGHDGTGVHCGISERYVNQEICKTEISFKGFFHLELDVLHQDWIYKYFGGWPAALRNELIYLEKNASNEILCGLWQLTYKSVRFPGRVVGGLLPHFKQRWP